MGGLLTDLQTSLKSLLANLKSGLEGLPTDLQTGINGLLQIHKSVYIVY